MIKKLRKKEIRVRLKRKRKRREETIKKMSRKERSIRLVLNLLLYLKSHGKSYNEWMVYGTQYGSLSLRVLNLILANYVFFFKHLIRYISI